MSTGDWLICAAQCACIKCKQATLPLRRRTPLPACESDPSHLLAPRTPLCSIGLTVLITFNKWLLAALEEEEAAEAEVGVAPPPLPLSAATAHTASQALCLSQNALPWARPARLSATWLLPRTPRQACQRPRAHRMLCAPLAA